ncbi:MAG: hypothetical protein ABR571_10125 [Jatrophihabitans sp.]|uniref:hypothetical protein n=1 Tax=Jatrophihabitans sp. TaxID=1932789 RepID=UPI0039135A10
MGAMPNKSTARELVEQSVIAGAGMVPVAGSPVAVAFAMAMGWSYNKRMRQWLEELANAVTELQEESDEYLTIEDLAQDDVFTDAVVNATRAAQATHQDEKLRALRNGVLNSVSPAAPTIDEQARVFRLVDELTPAHLRLLKFLDNPEAWFLERQISIPSYLSSSTGQIIEDGMPEFRGQRPWLDLLAADLVTARLLDRNIHGMISGASLWESSTSELGRRFLGFIADD